MPLSDDTLIDAMVEGSSKRVLFLVHHEGDIEASLRRLKRLTLDRIHQKLGSKAAGEFFTGRSWGWTLETILKGRLTFYPLSLALEGEEQTDSYAYDFVFWPDDRGRYAMTAFSEWLRLRKAGNVWRPTRTGGVKKDGPRTAWDRIDEEDFED